MIGRIVAICRVELTKAIRQKFTYVAPVVVLLTIGLIAFFRIQEGGRLDYSFVSYATSVTLNVPALALLIAFSATLMASELDSGTVRLAMLRPIHRAEFLLGKWILALGYALTLVVLTTLGTWAFMIGYGHPAGVEQGGELLFTGREMVTAYLGGAGLALLPFAAAASAALCVSTLARGAGAAVGLSLGGWLVLDALKYRLGFAPVIFSTYVETPWVVFVDRCDGLDAHWLPAIYPCIGVSAVTIALSLAVAIAAFRRRDLQA